MERDQKGDVQRRIVRVSAPEQAPIRSFHGSPDWDALAALRPHTLAAKPVPRPTQTTLMQELSQTLSRAERCVTRQLVRALEEEGCTIEQWRTLILLADGRGHSMTEVAEFALVPAPSLTRLIDRMVTDGPVHRTADAQIAVASAST